MNKRIRKVGSIKSELIEKSRESMLCAVQIFNNPNILFKAESYIVLSIIAWTYLLHGYYRGLGIDYRYFSTNGKRRSYDKTKNGAYKYWELERCLDEPRCPIDKVTKSNLKFLIGLRHEIEHQMTSRIDEFLSARFQACCLNFNHYIKELINPEMALDKYLSFSLQFSSIEEPQTEIPQNYSGLPKNISSFITNFDDELTNEEYNDPKYSYRILFIPKVVNKKGQADRVIEFIPANSPEAKGLNSEYVLIKDREKPKYLAGDVVRKMNAKGFIKFTMHNHTNLWKDIDGKNPGKGFGVYISRTWYWYDLWLTYVEDYCRKNKEKFSI